MRRTLSLVAAVAAGLVAGAVTSLAVQAPARMTVHGPTTAPPTSASPIVPVEPAPLPEPDEDVLLVWTSGGLPGGLAADVAALPGVTRITAVAGGTLDLAASHTVDGTTVDEVPPGWAIPLDALAVDPRSYAPFLTGTDRELVERLTPGRALLGSTSAGLRRLGPGDTVTLTSGHELTIDGIVDDTAVGAAELVVSRDTAAAVGITTERFLLVGHAGDRDVVEEGVRNATSGPVRVRGPGEAPYLRHGDAVLPQALIKERFGEFRYRPPAAGRDVEIDPAWVEEHIVDVDVAILGAVRCHRTVVKQLEGALHELADRDLGHLLDPDGYAGCFHPRLTTPVDAEKTVGSLSRHAWGIALDLNADDNPSGQASRQDDRLVEVFTRWGFTWGGFWLVPDPMHVEYLSPAELAPSKVVDGG